jgi:hypothetical protein
MMLSVPQSKAHAKIGSDFIEIKQQAQALCNGAG